MLPRLHPCTLALLHPCPLFPMTERLDEGSPLRYLICVPKVGLTGKGRCGIFDAETNLRKEVEAGCADLGDCVGWSVSSDCRCG